jgi:hypothetical protein
MRATLLLIIVTACGEPATPVSAIGEPTETECPPGGTTLTYENFAKPFMANYCNRCHDSALQGAARMGAPTFHDFDTYFGIRGVADHVDETTAAGPAAINRGMPPDGNKPTDDERYLLGEWIACDLPE